MYIVTGSTGLIGRAVISLLRKSESVVVALDHSSDPPEKWREFVRAFDTPPLGIVHLAAAVPRPPGRPDSAARGQLTRRVDQVVLDIAEEFNTHVVYASGCSLYSDELYSPMAEEDAPQVSQKVSLSPYLQAKLAGEKSFLATKRATVLRISNPVGFGISGSSVLGIFLNSARAGRLIEVWGSGNREQNYVHASDIAEAVKRSLGLRESGLFNIAGQEPTTMLELARMVASGFPGAGVVFSQQNDPGEYHRARFATDRAKNRLGWAPKIGIRESVANLVKCHNAIR